MIDSIDWNHEPWHVVRLGVARKAFSGNGATVALNQLAPGHEPRPHQHENEQIVYILQGCVDFHIGDEVIRLSAGGLARVPPNIIHYAEVVGGETVLNLDVFTPCRLDYAPAPR